MITPSDGACPAIRQRRLSEKRFAKGLGRCRRSIPRRQRCCDFGPRQPGDQRQQRRVVSDVEQAGRPSERATGEEGAAQQHQPKCKDGGINEPADSGIARGDKRGEAAQKAAESDGDIWSDLNRTALSGMTIVTTVSLAGFARPFHNTILSFRCAA